MQTNGSVDAFCRGTPQKWANLELTKMSIDPPNVNASHKTIHENFIRAIIDDEPLIAPATEGLHSVEMANAMIMSGIEGRPIDVPTDHDAYERMLQGLIEESKAKV